MLHIVKYCHQCVRDKKISPMIPPVGGGVGCFTDADVRSLLTLPLSSQLLSCCCYVMSVCVLRNLTLGKHEPTDHVAQSARTCTNTNAATRGPRGLLSPLGFVCERTQMLSGSWGGLAHAYDARERARVDLLQISRTRGSESDCGAGNVCRASKLII